MTSVIDKVLHKIYYDPKNTASFSSANNLYKSAKDKLPEITEKRTRDWLKSQITYTLHKPIIKKFRRNSIVVEFPDEQWQADLVDLSKYSSENKGYKYILTAIDIFSKYVWTRSLKTKAGEEVSKAFESIFKTGRVCRKLQSDQGKEFLNKQVKSIFKNYEIKFFIAKNKETKCAVIERFNRTLKAKMFKYFTSVGSRVYIDKLQTFTETYNKTVRIDQLVWLRLQYQSIITKMSLKNFMVYHQKEKYF